MVALGAQRNVEWLEGSGLAAGRWGVSCDAGCRAADVNGVITDDVFVAGDMARFPHPAYDYQMMALEHWGNAVDQAEIAAHNMISPAADRWAHLALPVFWSTQFGVEIKSIGVPTFADEVVLAQGSTGERRFVAVYGRRDRITAAVTFDHGMWLEFYGRLIARAAPFPPRFSIRTRTCHALAQSPPPRPRPSIARDRLAVRRGPRGEPHNQGRGGPDPDGQTARATRIQPGRGGGLERTEQRPADRGTPDRAASNPQTRELAFSTK